MSSIIIVNNKHVAVLITILIIMIIMGNGVHLFEGSNLSKSLYRLILIALDEISDVPLHGVADPFVVALLPARYNNNHNNCPPQLTTPTSVTLLLPFSPSAIKRPPTSVKSLSLCIARRHTRRQHPTSLSHSHPHFTHFMHHVTPFPPHMPPAYQLDRLQALESAQVGAQRPNVVVLQLLQRGA